MGKLKIKRIQTGIYFQQETLDKVNKYIEILNDVVKSVDKEEFKSKYGWYRDNIKLVDFTDRVLMQFLETFKMLGIKENKNILGQSIWEKDKELIYLSESSLDLILSDSLNYKQKDKSNPFDLLPTDSEAVSYFIAFEKMLKINYDGLLEMAKLYNNRSKRGLYISESLKDDFEIATKYFLSENLGGKSMLFNNVIKTWLIQHEIYGASDFLPFFGSKYFDDGLESYVFIDNEEHDLKIKKQFSVFAFDLISKYPLDFEG